MPERAPNHSRQFAMRATYPIQRGPSFFTLELLIHLYLLLCAVSSYTYYSTV
jgi:hypothetical protein